MEDKNSKQPMPKIYTECDLWNARGTAAEEIKKEIFSFFEENVNHLVTKRLLDFADAHQEVFKFKKQSIIEGCM